ncbi:MAG: ATP-binding protein [Planctomycetota bacterium]
MAVLAIAALVASVHSCAAAGLHELGWFNSGSWTESFLVGGGLSLLALLTFSLAAHRRTNGAGAARHAASREADPATPVVDSDLLSVFVEHLPAAVAMLDRDMRYIMVSRRWLQTYHQEQEQVIGRCHYDLFPNMPERWKALHRRCLAGEVLRADEDAWRPPGWDSDQILRWEIRPWKPGGADEAEIGGMLMFVEDLTSTFKLQQGAAEAAARLDMALDAGGLGCWDWDITSGFVQFDARFADQLALREEEMRPSAEEWCRRIHPSDLEVTRRALEAHLAGETPLYENEHRVRHADGSWRWILDRGKVVARDANGAPVRMVGTHADVSARKRLEQEVCSSELFLRSAIDSLDARTAVVDASGQIVLVNRAWRGFEETETRASEAEDCNCLAACNVRTDQVPEVAQIGEAIRAALAGHSEPRPVEYRCRSSVGPRWFLCTARGFDAGQERYAVVTHLEITTIKEVEAALHAHNEELATAKHAAEAASQAKSDFLANMSHEIRTPLTAIMGYAEILREDPRVAASPEQRAATIDTICTAGRHLMVVIDDVLDISKIEAGQMKVEETETLLARILNEVAGMIQQGAAAKKLTFSTKLATRLPDRIVTDPTRLRQILMNLATNAVKFTANGGVKVVAGMEERSDGARLIIDVEDTGPGLSPEQGENAFRAFAQGDTSVRRRFGGTGLGLTISRHLARLMGGDVVLAKSTPGSGACFRVDLPLRPVPGAHWFSSLTELEVEPIPSGPLPASRLEGRVLLAEDGPENQRLIAHILRKAGAEVVVAQNGRVALDLLDEAEANAEPFALLVTDIQMPEMDGYSLARATAEPRFDAADHRTDCTCAHGGSCSLPRCRLRRIRNEAARPQSVPRPLREVARSR